MRKIYLLAALTLAATLLAASPVLAVTIPTSTKNAVRSGEITPAQACQRIAAHDQEQNQQEIDVQACQQMVASASASASAPVQDQNAASPKSTGRAKTVSRLPDTGGSPLVSLTAGVLLMGGGLLLRRISH
jgi:LPXTG-motif cell wall-anchored protein